MAVPGSVVIDEITSGTVLVFILEQLKKRFPQIAGTEGWTMRAISALWALVSVIIISYEWTPTFGGGGVLTLTLPSFGAAIMAIWHWAEQFAVNEVIYQTTVKRTPVTPAATATPTGKK